MMVNGNHFWNVKLGKLRLINNFLVFVGVGNHVAAGHFQ